MPDAAALPEIRLVTLTGEALRPHLRDLARLRSAVFRDWPYLYDGDPDYEGDYLRSYARSPGAAVVLALVQGAGGERAVGAATCQPMAEASEPVRAAFAAGGIDPATACYFGESVLLPDYRGSGIGLGFFAHREAHARALGAATAAFLAVIRDPGDPRRPAGAVPLDGFWRRRGYSPRPDIVATFRWKEIGGAGEVENTLSAWVKPL